MNAMQSQMNAKEARAELATLLAPAIGGAGRPFTMSAVRRAFHLHLLLAKQSGGQQAQRREAMWAYDLLNTFKVEFLDELPVKKRAEALHALVVRRTQWAMPKPLHRRVK